MYKFAKWNIAGKSKLMDAFSTIVEKEDNVNIEVD